MRSRAATYLLIAVVTVVWGVILWKVFAPKDDVQAAPPPRKNTEVGVPAADTLVLDYRDPFLGTPAVKSAAAGPSTVTRVAPPPVEVAPAVEHRVRYLGTISRGGVSYGLVEINGVLHTIARGGTADGYRLDAIWQDSVRLRWSGGSHVVGLGG